jgi:hypothetical protein
MTAHLLQRLIIESNPESDKKKPPVSILNRLRHPSPSFPISW